jgi:hypothetical protein
MRKGKEWTIPSIESPVENQPSGRGHVPFMGDLKRVFACPDAMD